MSDQDDLKKLTSAALAMPTVWVDKLVISAGPQAVKISFAEMAGTGTAVFRFAVAMSRDDAKALHGLLTTMLMEVPSEKTFN